MKVLSLHPWLALTLACTLGPLSLAQEQTAKLWAPHSIGAERFGSSVSVSGATAVIGAPLEIQLSVSGVAYVFVESGGLWAQHAMLAPGDADVGDFFGTSVAVDGDTVVVGAPLGGPGATDSGAVYVFVREGSTWTSQAKLIANDGAKFDRFGESVAMSGDRVIVGAYLDDDDGSSSGAAYVFVRSGGAWSQEAKLTASDAAAGDWFGRSVSMSGSTALVGSPYEDAWGTTGSAYVFVRNGATWSEQAKLTANDGKVGDRFGHCVSVLGSTALVGAPFDDIETGSPKTDGGSAYFYERNGVSWTQVDHFIASDIAAGDELGSSVSLGEERAVLSAHRSDDLPWFSTGAAYVVERNGTNWSQASKLVASDAEAQDWFGFSVCVSGDTAFLGAPFEDETGPACGAAYVFWLGECSPPSNYCVGSPNSAGPGALIGHSGSQSVSRNDFTLRASQCPTGQWGLFFYGPRAGQVPLGNGFLCVSGPLYRLPVVTTDALGSASYGLDMDSAPNPGGLQPGDVWHFQFWYRDPAAGGGNSNLSDGLEVTFCP